MYSKIFAAAFFLLSSSLVWADVVEFNSGKIAQGEIIKVTETGVTLRSGGDILGISFSQVRDIRESTQARNSANVDMARSFMNTYKSPDSASRSVAAPASQNATPSKTNKKVTVYMTSWCGYCRKMIAFLNQQGIRYTAYDIEKNSAAYKDFKKYGGSGVPVVVVGEQVIAGYNPDAVVAALQ